MAFKLIKAAQDRWRAVNARRLVALVKGRRHVPQGETVKRRTEQEAQIMVA